MSTHTLSLTPRHADGTLCGHTGPDGCPGTGDLFAACPCGWHMTGGSAKGITAIHTEHVRNAGGAS